MSGAKLTKEKDGLLYYLTNRILKNAWVPQPDLALSAALCTLSILINRKNTFMDNCCNLYCLNIAPSGGGKDAPQQAVKNVLMQLGLKRMIGSGDYVSDASLTNSLENRPCRVDVIDEAAGFLATATKGQASYASKVDDILCELYTSSNNYYTGRELAEGVRGACARPFVTALMSTTPRGLEQGVSVKSVDKGLLGRCLLFMGDRNVRMREPSPEYDLGIEEMDALLNIAKYIPDMAEPGHYRRKYGEDEVADTHVVGEATLKDDEAKATYKKLMNKYSDMCWEEDDYSQVKPVIARGFQMICKIALIHAIAVDPFTLPAKISSQSLEFADQIVYNNIERFRVALATMLFENVYEEKYMKIRSVIEKEGTVSKAVINNRVRGVDPALKNKIYGELIENKLITYTDVVTSKGKLTNGYKWIGE